MALSRRSDISGCEHIKRHNKVGIRIDVLCTPTKKDYNKYMGAVNFNDKMCRLDKTRRTYKWYVRIDRNCVAWALFNAFVIEEKFRVHGRTRLPAVHR